MTWLVASADTLPGMLTTGRADGIGQFIVGEPLLAKGRGAQAGSCALLCRCRARPLRQRHHCQRSTIKSNPDLVRRFVAATMQGLKDAIANPREAGAIMNKHHREVDADIATGETKIVGTLTGQPLGVLDAARVKRRSTSWAAHTASNIRSRLTTSTPRLRPELAHVRSINRSQRHGRACPADRHPADGATQEEWMLRKRGHDGGEVIRPPNCSR